MKHVNFLSKSSSRSMGHRVTTLALTVGSPSAHRRGTMLKLISILAIILTIGVGQIWGTPEVLFHETFGNNSGSARDWDDSYKDQSGVLDVYKSANYTIINAKQSKNNDACTASGLRQTTTGTDASIVIGPLDVSDYEDLTLSFMYNAGSIKKTYNRSAQYKTSSSGSWSDLTVSGTKSTSCNEQTASLPEAAEGIKTLYLKIIFNTSNTNAKIDEVELSGTESAPSCTELGTINGSFS